MNFIKYSESKLEPSLEMNLRVKRMEREQQNRLLHDDSDPRAVPTGNWVKKFATFVNDFFKTSRLKDLLVKNIPS